MNYNFKKAWSTAGSLNRTSSFGGHPKKYCRHLSLVSNKSSAKSVSFYDGSRLRRSFDNVFGSGSIENSSAFNPNSFERFGGWKNGGLFNINVKETMMDLNGRLMTYLEKVTSLEEENHQLERKIKEWYAKNEPQQLPDFSKYLKTIDELQKEIFDGRMDNIEVLLHIENARLAGDDLQSKYNMELSLRKMIEADVVDLRKGLDGLTLERCDLEFQLEQFTEDLMLLKKDHNEEVKNLKEQLGARVHVEVDAAPAVDHKKVLSNIRNEYEGLMERNLKDVEKWFVTKSEELKSQMVSGAEQLQTEKSEVINLRHTIQNLEIDLQTQLSTISALKGTLSETEERYSSQVVEIQEMVNNIEANLAKMRYDLDRQNHEYKILTDVKTRLEMEITRYKQLMEEDIHISTFKSTGNRGLKIVSITEDLQNGKVISQSQEVHHLQL